MKHYYKLVIYLSWYHSGTISLLTIRQIQYSTRLKNMPRRFEYFDTILAQLDTHYCKQR